MTYELAALVNAQLLPALDESGAKTIFVSTLVWAWGGWVGGVNQGEGVS